MENKADINDVMRSLQDNQPIGYDTDIWWEYPGYVHIQLNKDSYIAFGKHTAKDVGYSWNDENGKISGEVDDLDAEQVALTFWGQMLKDLAV